jgi:hypothetical protein
MKHPKDRRGRFRDILRGLSRTSGPNTSVFLPEGTRVSRTGVGWVIAGDGETKLVRDVDEAVMAAFEISARSAHSHSLGYRAFRSYQHFRDDERRIRKYFKHKTTPEEWRQAMRERGMLESLELTEARGVRGIVNLARKDWAEAKHPRGRGGLFTETFHSLAKPGRVGGEAGVAHIAETPFKVERTRTGFDVHHDTAPTQSFPTAEATAKHVDRQLGSIEQERAAAAAEAKRRAAEDAKYEAQRQQTHELRVRQMEEMNKRYKTDEQGRRIYRHYAKDFQTLQQMVDPRSPSYGELWGGVQGRQRNEIVGVHQARAHKVLHNGETVRGDPWDDPETHAVEFVVENEALDPYALGGTDGIHQTRFYGTWDMQTASKAAIDQNLIRRDGEFVKIKVKILRSTMERAAAQSPAVATLQ